ncbi:MAG: ribonuclease III [Clostridia bacterium]|nr:ribonuclease III [Clostridia bacterium]
MASGFCRRSEESVRMMNPVTLAFVGDAVYSLYVREKLADCGDGKTADLQRSASKIVSAHGQNRLLEKIQPLFTETEAAVFRRGRNAKKATKSKSATVGEYNRSTGLEAVLGYLYLIGDFERIETLLSAGGLEFKGEKASEAFKP